MIFDDLKVGDTFRQKSGASPSWIRVTEITENGFKYVCEPHHVYPARYGPSLVTNGEFYVKNAPPEFWDYCYTKVEAINEQWDWIERTWQRQS